MNVGSRPTKNLVPLEGLEPPHLSVTDFESAASTVPPQRLRSRLRETSFYRLGAVAVNDGVASGSRHLNEQHAGNDQCCANGTRKRQRAHRKADQTKVVEQQRGDHLARHEARDKTADAYHGG